jgi:hypothetical protein
VFGHHADAASIAGQSSLTMTAALQKIGQHMALLRATIGADTPHAMTILP